MYKCIKCSKEFSTPSKLEAHKNRKNPCNISKKEYKCNICNIIFVRPSHQKEHEKTQKHIKNIKNINNDIINSDHNNTINNDIENKFNELQNKNTELEHKNTELQNKFNELEKINKELQNKNTELEKINKELQNKNTELEQKFNLIEKISNKESNNTEYIYIVHERTFVKTNSNIYKIGKTKNIKNRLNGYSKGSKLLFTIPCIDSTIMEKIILKYLKENNKYIQAKEYGNEYFICELNNLMNDIYNLVKQNNLENI